MGGSGPPPAENRRRRNKDTYADVSTTVTDDVEAVNGPELLGEWSVSTRSWYETWRRAPQSGAFVSTDWQRLAMMAPIVETYFATHDPKLFPEIRLNESLLGATHVDRLKGRIKVERPQAPAEDATPTAQPAGTDASVTNLASRRKRLTG